MAKAPEGKLSAFAEMRRDIDRYWFAFGSATSMGVFRILMGFMNLANLLLILPFFDAWFTERGFTPIAVTEHAAGSLDRHFLLFSHEFTLPFTVPRLDLMGGVTNSHIFLAFYWLTIVAALLTTLGLWTRISSIVLAVGIVTIQHRNVLVLHGGDSVVRLGAMYLAIAPSGKACSLDRLIGLWKGRIKPGPALVSLWPQRVIAFNLALIYFTTWWVKMDGQRWRNGTATWYPAHLAEFYRFWVPPFVKAPWMAPILTYGTLATELAMGTLVFWRPARKWVLLAGLLMHGGIEYTMNIPLFAFSMCSWYVVFYEGEEISEWFSRLGHRLRRFRLSVHAPPRTDLQSPPVTALRAMDPLGLVEYDLGSEADLTADHLGSPVSKPTLAMWSRTMGAWVLALAPGLWRRVVSRAFPARAEV